MAAQRSRMGQRRKRENSPRSVKTNEGTPAKAVNEPATKQIADVLKIVVVGDIYWDTVIVPWPSEGDNQKSREIENSCYRIDRRAGTWLLDRFIDRGKNQINGFKDQIAVIGPSKNDPELAPHTWGRAVTVVKLFPKSGGDKLKGKVYRICESYGWIAGKERGRETYPPISIEKLERYEEVFRAPQGAYILR